jgi:polyhydroxyalkanoate synthesis regulator protein
MSRDFLSQVIRSYGVASRGLVGDRLEQSLRGLATPLPQRDPSQA